MRAGPLIIAVILLLPTGARADKPMTINVSQLTMGTAVTMAEAAIAACRERGIEASVTIVDRDGIPQVSLRDTLAPPLSLVVSRKKAYTAAMFRVNGSVLEAHGTHAPLATIGAGLAFSAGSVPIAVGGKFYGAIGVSGAPQGTTDEQCAAAGLKSIRTDLEMQ